MQFIFFGYLAWCSDDEAKDDFCWDSVEDWAMALDIMAALLATIELPDSNPVSTWVDITFPSWVLADDNLVSFSFDRDLRRWSRWYSAFCWAEISADDSFAYDDSFLTLAVVDIAVEDDLAAMEDIEEDSWCETFFDCCCIDVEDALDASATRAAVLEDKLVAATAVLAVVDSMATEDDLVTDDEATCEEWDSCACWWVREDRFDSSTVRGSTTILDLEPLKDPFLSNADDAEYLSAEDFLA